MLVIVRYLIFLHLDALTSHNHLYFCINIHKLLHGGGRLVVSPVGINESSKLYVLQDKRWKELIYNGDASLHNRTVVWLMTEEEIECCVQTS
jgi:hypothetical protein